MKKILRDKFGKFKSLKINLLDGQRRGEVIFRRMFVLLVGALIIYLLLLAFVGKKDQNVEEVSAVEEFEEVVEWVDGDRVTYKEGGVVEIVPAENFESAKVPVVEGKGVVDDSIRQYIKNYGGKIDDGYLSLLREYCGEEAVKVVVAISVAETSMGKNTDKQSNYFGWHLGGDVNYDPGVLEMAREICRGVQKSYMSIGHNRAVTEAYTGGDRVETWTRNFTIAYESM